MQLIIDTKQTRISVQEKCFFIERDGLSRRISPKRVSSIAILTNCEITSKAICLAAVSQVPIVFFNRLGRAQARIWSPHYSNIATLRVYQLQFFNSPTSTDWIIHLLSLKGEMQRISMKMLERKASGMSSRIREDSQSIQMKVKGLQKFRYKTLDEVRSTIMGVEGGISRIYWQCVSACLPSQYSFDRRSRRPAQDMFNAALNYWYGMLYSRVEGALICTGLDPQIGLLHAIDYRTPSLTFDMIEPLRPFVDKMLIMACFDKLLLSEDFSKISGGLVLSKKGKGKLIPLFNSHLEDRFLLGGKKRKLHDHLLGLSADLASEIRKFKNS